MVKRLMNCLGFAASALFVLFGAPMAIGQTPASPLTSAQLKTEYSEWRELEPGLELRAFTASKRSELSDQLIVVLRIDPEQFAFELLIADSLDEQRKAAPAWLDEHDLVAVTNAGMFAASEAALPVGFTKVSGEPVNPRINQDNTIFATTTNDITVPNVQIIDRECDDFDALRPHYASMLQSIRMISCTGENVWSQQDRQWSTAALATDIDGRVLFIHSRSPHTVHDFIGMLQALPLSIARAMYLEGGPESTLYAQSGGIRLQRYGSFETGFFESDDNAYPWPLPNVIGVVRRQNSEHEAKARLHDAGGDQ